MWMMQEKNFSWLPFALLVSLIVVPVLYATLFRIKAN